MTRFYTWQGQVYPSVTTILQAVAKPALVPWAARRVAEAAVADAHVLVKLREIDPEAAIERLAKAVWRNKTRAALTGTQLHRAAEAITGHGRFELTPESAPFVRQFEAFLAACQPSFRHREVAVYSRTHGYAGTLDAIAEMGGRTVLLDFKTSKGVYSEHALQLAAYRHAEFVGADDGTELPLPAIDAAYILHITPERWRLIEMDAGDETFAAFLAAKTLSAWLAQQRGMDAAEDQ